MRVPTVCLLVVCALSVSVREKSLLRPAGSVRGVDSTQYGALLLDVIDLQLEAKDSVSEIIGVLDELLVDVKTQQNNADRQNEIDTKECSDKDNEYTQIIEEAKTAISDAQSKLDRLRPEKIRLENEIDTEEGNKKKNREDRENAIQARKDAHELFVSRKGEHEASVDACNEALDILKNLKSEDEVAPAAIQTASSFNFIQIQKASVVLMDLKEKIERMNTDTSAYTPYLKVLLEIAASQDRFSNQETVGEINRLLVELRDDIEESLRQLEQAEADEVASHNTYLDANQTEFNNIEDRLKELYSTHKQVVEDIKTQEGIVEAKSEVKRVHEALLEALRQKCEAQAKKYRDETDERTEEIDIINQVKELFLNPEETLPSVDTSDNYEVQE